jgi:hypothetical protein
VAPETESTSPIVGINKADMNENIVIPKVHIKFWANVNFYSGGRTNSSIASLDGKIQKGLANITTIKTPIPQAFITLFSP